MADLLLCQSQVRQNLGAGFFSSQQVVACAAILRDLPAVARHMRFVMAAETAGKIGMADVDRITAPIDLQFRKNVAIVNGQHALAGFLNLGFVLAVSGGMLLLVELLPLRWNATRGVVAAVVFCAQQLDALLAGER